MAVVHMRTQLGWTEEEVGRALRLDISTRSMRTWVKLYKQTRRVIKDPDFYKKRGPETLLNPEQRVLLREILETDSSL